MIHLAYRFGEKPNSWQKPPDTDVPGTKPKEVKPLKELEPSQTRLTANKNLPKSKEDYCKVKILTATANRQKVGSTESLDILTQSGLDLRLAKRLNYSEIQIFGFLSRVCSRSSAITNK
jgi:hypothetical protein